ncbi:MAG: membrane dipeptidase, partial [Gammaproteobacteria bacterium]
DHVGFGSDFDGTVVPEPISDVAGLVALREAMKEHGYNDELMQKLCHGNWLKVLEKTWATSATIG